MYTEPPAQYCNNQPQSTQREYLPAVSPANHQPVKKRRVLSPAQQLHQHHHQQNITQQQQVVLDNSCYKVMKILHRVF